MKPLIIKMNIRLIILAAILSVLFLHLQAQTDFKQWTATPPPMGWNSWDCYGPTVQESEVKANADYMAEHLKTFGREYIVVDIRGERGGDRMTRLTKDEQYSLMTFFMIFRSPLMFGGDLPSNDPFTLSLLTNKEVLKMHRESTNVRQLFQQDGKLAVTSGNPLSGDKYIALFNISDNPEPMEIQVPLKNIGINTQCEVINLWTDKSLGETEVLSVQLRPHACGLFICKKILSDYPIQQVKLNKVELTDNFWLPQIRRIQQVAIPYALKKCDREGRFENFLTAEKVMRGGVGKVRGVMPFDDTDVYKIIEGASLSLVSLPNEALDKTLDSLIAIIARGQEPDGYLTTWRTIDPKNPPASWVHTNGERWNGLASSHELYNSGHLFEAAAAHYWATGKQNFLNIALKNADLLVKTFLNPDSKEYNKVPGHQIAETGLIKLFQITGNRDYLLLAKHFLDNRGQNITGAGAYSQDHKPVIEQDEVVGHAVRAVYMYTGMTDIAALYDDSEYRNAINKLWGNMIAQKMYITGGLGARHEGEAFGDNYELPNLTAYAETCAAIGGAMWADRMFRLSGKADYYNILERMLYNGVISGISLDGTHFFYPNPLEADGVYKFNQGNLTRSEWFDCSCCPTNLIRFLPSVPDLIYATQDNNLYVNLFVANNAKINMANNTVNISQSTDYPWNGDILINISPEKKEKFTLKIRIPDWAANIFPSELYSYANKISMSPTVVLNGENMDYEIDNGYISITKEWEKDETVSVNFPMDVRKIEANKNVKDDAEKFTIQRGPLVYCLEQSIATERVCPSPLFDNNFKVEYRPNLLGGIAVLKSNQNFSCELIPYYSWANRGVSQMKVWFEKK